MDIAYLMLAVSMVTFSIIWSVISILELVICACSTLTLQSKLLNSFRLNHRIEDVVCCY